MWSSPWSGGKLLFLLTRYSPFVDIPVLMYCESFKWCCSYWSSYTKMSLDQFGYALTQHMCNISFELAGCEWAHESLVDEMMYHQCFFWLIKLIFHRPSSFNRYGSISCHAKKNCWLIFYLLAILTIRTWAVFGRGKRLALFGFLGGLVIMELVVIGLYLRSFTGAYSTARCWLH